MSVASYQIRGRVSVPGAAVTASVSVVGVALMLAASALGWGSVWVTVGVIVVALGAVLLLFVVNAARRANVTATLNDDAFVLVGAGTQVALAWRDVRQVSMSANTLIIRDDSGREIKVVAPPGSRPEELDTVAAAMAKRLDADRGYRAL